MMREKRFERWNDYSCKVKDNQEGILLRWEDVVQKLNEQQDTITKLQKELKDCEKFRYSVFKRMNDIELSPIIEPRTVTLKEAEEPIRVTKYEELFDDE